jgi:hypothetical protein
MAEETRRLLLAIRRIEAKLTEGGEGEDDYLRGERAGLVHALSLHVGEVESLQLLLLLADPS